MNTYVNEQTNIRQVFFHLRIKADTYTLATNKLRHNEMVILFFTLQNKNYLLRRNMSNAKEPSQDEIVTPAHRPF